MNFHGADVENVGNVGTSESPHTATQHFNPMADPTSSSLPQFDVIEWYPAEQSCERYFLNHAQHEYGVQALAKFLNIKLPVQWPTNPVTSSQAPTPGLGSVSLVPYIRRFVVTGWDKDAVLRGFFGDDWRKGIGSIVELERRNYIFLAKSGGWSKCKEQYDMNSQETVPFLKPPDDMRLVEIETAEKQWSEWLLLEDWMVGDCRPPDGNGSEIPSMNG